MPANGAGHDIGYARLAAEILEGPPHGPRREALLQGDGFGHLRERLVDARLRMSPSFTLRSKSRVE
jgi:hypothetical protein